MWRQLVISWNVLNHSLMFAESEIRGRRLHDEAQLLFEIWWCDRDISHDDVRFDSSHIDETQVILTSGTSVQTQQFRLCSAGNDVGNFWLLWFDPTFSFLPQTDYRTLRSSYQMWYCSRLPFSYFVGFAEESAFHSCKRAFKKQVTMAHQGPSLFLLVHVMLPM